MRNPDPKLYAVTSVDDNGLPVSFRVVKAHTRQQAIRHVAADSITANVATFEDGQRAAANGVETEDATKTPPETE